MIIAFSGRKSSGKTTLSNYLIDKGFEKISFATELKNLVSKLYDFDIKDLSDTIKKESKLEIPLIWNEKKANELSRLLDIDKKLNSDFKNFFTIRDALQYIGTDILRSYDKDFHVKSIKKYISADKNYVLDDVRFINELNFIKDIGGICIFIMRPYYFKDYSNHESEIQLNRKNFDHLILNDRSEKSLLKKFYRFEKGLLKSSKRERKFAISKPDLEELLKTKSTVKIAKDIGCSRDTVSWWCNRYLIPISRNRYTLNHDAFLNINKESAYWAGLLSADGCVKEARKTHINRNNFVLELANNDRELIDGFQKFLKTDKPPYIKKSTEKNKKLSYLLTINSPFIIDDIKLWNLEPRKSRNNKVPDCIKKNDELFKYWLVGLIDGDGSIYIRNSKSRKFEKNYKSIAISVLASKEIINYLIEKYPSIRCSVHQEKNINNLYNAKYNGKWAVKLYNEIYNGVGLKRKWSKVEPFLSKNGQ